MEIVRASPDFLLNSGSDDSANLYSWAALAAGSSTPLASRTAILTSVTNKDCSNNVMYVVSIMPFMF